MIRLPLSQPMNPIRLAPSIGFRGRADAQYVDMVERHVQPRDGLAKRRQTRVVGPQPAIKIKSIVDRGGSKKGRRRGGRERDRGCGRVGILGQIRVVVGAEDVHRAGARVNRRNDEAATRLPQHLSLCVFEGGLELAAQRVRVVLRREQ